MRSISSAVRRFVTSATTLRCPPQLHFQTSQANVRCSNVAQSILGRFFCSSAFGVELELGATGRGATLERPAAAGASTPWKFVRCRPLGTKNAANYP